jgi:hypothetical protein
MTMKVIPILLVLALACSGCATASADRAESAVPGSCFGLPCAFSGRLTVDEEKGVPAALHGAFHIESVRGIGRAEVEKVLAHKEKVAEETHDGATWLAVKDYRCVDFGNGTSGMMIVIERYRVRGS